MGPTNVTFQGVNYVWNNAKIIMFNMPLIGITKFSIKAKQNKTNEYGLGNKPIYRGLGNKEYDASMTVYFDQLVQWVNAVSNGDILDIPYFDFPMVLVGTRVIPQTVIVRAAEFLESPFEVAQGDTKILVDIPLVIGGIDWKQ